MRARTLVPLVVAVIILEFAAAGITDKAYAGGIVTSGEFCNAQYTGIAHQQYQVIPGSAHGNVCLRNNAPQEKSNGFTITRAYRIDRATIYAYPNIAAGYQWGRHALRSFEPVQAKSSGQPWTTVQWNARGKYHAAYDIWFNKTRPANPLKLGQANGAEVMIWLNGGPGWKAPHITIDGYRFNLTWWITNHHGVKWPLIIFQAAQGKSLHSFHGNLRPFIEYAARHVRGMSMNLWLTGIDFGFEVTNNSVAGSYVRNYRLTGISTSGYQTRSFTSIAKATESFTARGSGIAVTARATATRRATRTVTLNGPSSQWRATAIKARATARDQAMAASRSLAGAAARATAKAQATARLNALLHPPPLKKMYELIRLRTPRPAHSPQARG